MFSSYAVMHTSSPQTARVVVGNHVELDTLIFKGTGLSGSDVELSTGVDQANGNITLKNKRYLIHWEMWGQTNEGVIQCVPTLHGSSTQVAVEAAAGQVSPWGMINDSNANDQSQPQGVYWIADATAADYKFRLRFWWLNTAWFNVQSRVTVFDLGAVDNGATFGSYAHFSLSASQTTNLNIGDHVEFDQVDYVGTAADGTNATVSTGAGQLDGTITLKDYRWILITSMGGSCNEGRSVWEWQDTGGTAIPQESGASPIAARLAYQDNNQTDSCPIASSMMIVDARAADVEMEMTCIDEANLIAAYTGQCFLLAIPILES